MTEGFTGRYVEDENDYDDATESDTEEDQPLAAAWATPQSPPHPSRSHASSVDGHSASVCTCT